MSSFLPRICLPKAKVGIKKEKQIMARVRAETKAWAKIGARVAIQMRPGMGV